MLVIADTNSSLLEAEFELNNDSLTDTFYEIDMSKIKVEASSRGLKKEENENDIYVVNSKGTIVYYPLGVKIGPKIYFSITSKLVDITRVAEEDLSEDNSSVTIFTRPAIVATKNTETYTNELSITVNTTLAEGETLIYKIGTLSDETAIETLPYTIDLSLADLSDAQESDIIAGNKTVTIAKTGVGYTDTEVVEIDNLDIQVPTVSDTATYTAYETFNTITLADLADLGGAGIKEARYEYVTKVDELGADEPYYSTPPTIDSAYLLSVGKKSNAEIIKLAKNIKTISLVIVDAAGNASAVKTYTFTDAGMLIGQ